MAQCSRCTHLPGSGKQPKEYTKLGMYRCSKSPPWVFRSPFAVRECESFSPVAEADLPARIKFEEANGYTLRSIPEPGGVARP